MKGRESGFTLLELIFSLAISGIVMGALFLGFQAQKKSAAIQEQVSFMQQNLRAAMYYITTDIKMAGFDPMLSGNFSITNVAPNNGNGSITLTVDENEDGAVGPGANETVQYLLYDDPITPSVGTDLGRRLGGGQIQLLAENIEALGFAYAFDRANDGNLDLSPNNNIIWAIDRNGNGTLDWVLDSDDDGDIDQDDAGVALAVPVTINRIRAVKIWLLARSERQDEDLGPVLDEGGNIVPYVVADQRIVPDRRYRRLMTTIVDCRNMRL